MVIQLTPPLPPPALVLSDLQVWTTVREAAPSLESLQVGGRVMAGGQTAQTPHTQPQGLSGDGESGVQLWVISHVSRGGRIRLMLHIRVT